MTAIALAPTDNAQFYIQLHQAIRGAQYNSTHVGVLVIDFDAGQPSSDEAGGLSDAAREKALAVIAANLRESDALCHRPEGDAAVLLSCLRDPAEAMQTANMIHDSLERAMQTFSAALRWTPKIGVSLFPKHGSAASTLLECAARAVKAGAGNPQECCYLYSQEDTRAGRSPLRLSFLRQAIIQDDLFLQYQPKIDLKCDHVTGFEVLARWDDAELGLIMPDEFIPLAERTGLIVPLTLWVLKAALQQCRRWREHGISIALAVNLSMWNFHDPALSDQIAAVLRDAAVLPDQLEFEITESAIMDDPDQALRTINAIRDLGVRFTIDDFGAGYSSLAYLKKLPATSIKIDKALTLDLERDGDKDSAVIVRAIIELAHKLHLKVIAEGVETPHVKELLVDFGCDEAQGYYFSPPMGAADVTSFMRDALRPGAGKAPSCATLRAERARSGIASPVHKRLASVES
jgi:EAL domain-containing protein (putative c-di-GMP-specific phosphodiesterase class I)/GGDEF domain-containing protein